MTHHVVVSVDVVSTAVLLSARVEASIVIQPALAVIIHTHVRSHTFEWNRTISSACYYYMVTHLDRAGIPVAGTQYVMRHECHLKEGVIRSTH